MKVFCKPGEYCVLPFLPLVEIKNLMVLVLDSDESRGSVEELQCGVHLYAFSKRHVMVHVSVEEQDRGVDLVGVVERTLLHI